MAADTLAQQDVIELSKQGYFTILPDENLGFSLRPNLG
jgi:hypothetical protein